MSDNIRFSININPALRNRLNKLPWGIRGEMAKSMLDLLCDLHEKHGNDILGAVLSKEIILTRRVTKGDKTRGV